MKMTMLIFQIFNNNQQENKKILTYLLYFYTIKEKRKETLIMKVPLVLQLTTNQKFQKKIFSSVMQIIFSDYKNP